MDYTERFVHVCVNYQQDPAPVYVNDSYEITLSYDNDRAPYVLVELVSGTIHAVNAVVNTYVVKTREIAGNQYNNLNLGTSLALLDYNTQVTAGHHNYDIIGFSSKSLYSNTKKLNIYFTDESGSVIDMTGGQILGFNLIFKVSYPIVGSVPQLYRTQIPL